MKNVILFAALLLGAAVAEAQGKNPVSATVKVYGNCTICEAAIEKAGTIKGAAQTDWNKDTKLATISFDARRTSKEAVLKQIALAGYDNELYLAPEEAYAKLQSCCQYPRKEKHPPLASTTAPGISPVKPAGHSEHNDQPKQPAQQADPVQVLLENYITLKDALVKSDAKGASGSAVTLLGNLKAIKMESLGTKEHAAWMKTGESLTTLTQQISKSTDLAKQREYFAALSEGFYELAKASSPASTIYYQHCPMYNDGKGANWLSRESAIKNPYYGSMMLSCGKTTETIGQ